MIRDQSRIDDSLSRTRRFVRDAAIPNENGVEREDRIFLNRMCCRVAGRVVQIFGGQGYVKGRGIERFYRDVRAARIYEGASQIHLLNIAKQLLLQPAGTGAR